MQRTKRWIVIVILHAIALALLIAFGSNEYSENYECEDLNVNGTATIANLCLPAFEAAWDPPRLTPNSSASVEFEIEGCVPGDWVIIAPGVELAEYEIVARVTAPGIVTVTITNLDGPEDLEMATCNIVVIDKE